MLRTNHCPHLQMRHQEMHEFQQMTTRGSYRSAFLQFHNTSQHDSNADVCIYMQFHIVLSLSYTFNGNLTIAFIIIK